MISIRGIALVGFANNVERATENAFSVTVNEGFSLKGIDIRAAVLQSRGLEREVFMEPPRDIKNEERIKKLKKPQYGLNNA